MVILVILVIPVILVILVIPVNPVIFAKANGICVGVGVIPMQSIREFTVL